MILYQGKLYDDSKQNELLETLKKDCYQTIAGQERLKTEIVIEACHKLAQKVKTGAYDNLILPLLKAFDIPYDYFLSSIPMFDKESLIKKVHIELGTLTSTLEDIDNQTKRTIYPLGILFHIAAGNVDVLPAYSVIEGLLAGNVNILKLPSGDKGLSVKLLSELIEIEPILKDYIYVFDVPSTEVETLKIFADLSDGIVVWGGDQAVMAARKMASVTTKIIPWGHKLSFAYATLDATNQELTDLADHIAMTDQVLCSSCQGIFVDTEDRALLDAFAKRFFDILIQQNQKHKPIPYGMVGKQAIQIHYEKMIQYKTGKTIFSDQGLSVVVTDDHNLELSMLFRNVWVKGLKREALVQQLKPHKNHLQTASLLCSREDRESLIELLAKAGATRITQPKDMSYMRVGESHDGTYALREYTRIVETFKTLEEN